jgi:hypothetical protein
LLAAEVEAVASDRLRRLSQTIVARGLGRHYRRSVLFSC